MCVYLSVHVAIIVYMKERYSIFKRLVSIFVIGVILFCIPSIFCACVGNNKYDGEMLRLHIRANSNSDEDQDVKLVVRNAVNEYMCENVRADSFDRAYSEIEKRLDSISSLCTDVLKENGFDYTAKASLDYEYFPTRQYGDVVVDEGYYHALIVELGEALGNNWWCVVYPPLCYGDSFEYRSFFADLFA